MEYFININNEKRGPYTLKELAERSIEATTLVMDSNSNEWIPAWQVEELRSILMDNSNENMKEPVNETETLNQESTINGKPIEEIPYVEAQTISDKTYYHEPEKKSKTMQGCLIGGLIGIAFLIALMIFTCPNTDQHKEALSDVVTQTITESAQDAGENTNSDVITKAFQTIANAFTRKVIDAAVDNLIHVDNYVICSVGKVHYNNQDKIVSFGVFNHVFTVNKEQLKEASEKYYKTAELNIEQELEQKVQKELKENIIDPTTDLIKGVVGSAINGILDEFGTSSDNANSADMSDQLEDSI